ncbi:MAG TPA: PadR family transcriptional regulator [Alphaproteobacteria bacterium]
MRCNHLGDHHGRRRFAHEPFGRGPFGQRGRMGRGFGRRHFESGDLRFVILHLLAEKPRHGYEIIKAIEDHFGGMYSPSPGVIYPTLTLLEELGYAGVAATEEGGKKLYAITDAGRNFLAENRATLDEVLARFEAISRAYGGGPAPEIRRAVHNFKLALSLRLGKGPLSEAQVRDVTAAIDAAASAIERS